jgi:hypothetical protein
MKISKYLALGLLAISLTPVFGQPTPQTPGDFNQRLQTIINKADGSSESQTQNLTRFNLDFPGGTPKDLVAAIEKATGKPLNVIIPIENADVQLPPLKMNDVVTPQLFMALEVASVKQVAVVTSTFGGGRSGPASYSTFESNYGFETGGKPTDNSIWYFHVSKPSLPLAVPTESTQKICKYYPLEIYLNRGLTVDDITTAIQTGWKMMGETSPPEISFHKETKLLIAVGEPDKLEVIDNVLKALQPPPPNPTADFQERLQQIIKNQAQASVPAARPPLSPEDQVNLLEQNRKNSQQLPPAVLPPPSLKPEAGQ